MSQVSTLYSVSLDSSTIETLVLLGRCGSSGSPLNLLQYHPHRVPRQVPHCVLIPQWDLSSVCFTRLSLASLVCKSKLSLNVVILSLSVSVAGLQASSAQCLRCIRHEEFQSNWCGCVPWVPEVTRQVNGLRTCLLFCTF